MSERKPTPTRTIGVDISQLVLDIIALYPNGVPPDKAPLMKRIMQQLGQTCGIIDALQQTAGEVFFHHARGNTDIADVFYEALLSITVPKTPK